MIEVRPATSAQEFIRLHVLIDEMAIWDAEMSGRAGFSAEAVHDAYYRKSAEDLRAHLTASDATMLMAREGDELLGCLGFDRFDADTAEVQKFFVAPDARGRGIGRALIGALIPCMTAAGYRAACLETATFMADAIALYGKAGFRV